MLRIKADRMNENEKKEIEEMEAMLEEHFIANNHSNCDVGYSYSEIHFCKERDIKGVAHSIATALVKAGYRKHEDTVKEFAEKLKDTITEEIALCEQKRSDLLYGGQWIVLTEKKIVLTEQIKMLNVLAEQFGKEEKE